MTAMNNEVAAARNAAEPPADDKLDRHVVATRVQLMHEIEASGKYRSMRKLAPDIPEEYTTFTKRMKGTYTLDMHTIFRVLELLGITPAEFFSRVDQRVKGTLRD